MKKTRPTVLVSYGIGAAVIAFVIELVLAATGAPIVVPPVTLSVTLVVIAVLIVLAAIPVRRTKNGIAKKPVNPFRALRVAVAARATSIVGVVVVGIGLGVIGHLVTRPVIVDAQPVVLSVFAAVGGAVLATAGLIAENFCRLPPDDRSYDRRRSSEPDRDNIEG